VGASFHVCLGETCSRAPGCRRSQGRSQARAQKLGQFFALLQSDGREVYLATHSAHGGSQGHILCLSVGVRVYHHQTRVPRCCHLGVQIEGFAMPMRPLDHGRARNPRVSEHAHDTVPWKVLRARVAGHSSPQAIMERCPRAAPDIWDRVSQPASADVAATKSCILHRRSGSVLRARAACRTRRLRHGTEATGPAKQWRRAGQETKVVSRSAVRGASLRRHRGGGDGK